MRGKESETDGKRGGRKYKRAGEMGIFGSLIKKASERFTWGYLGD